MFFGGEGGKRMFDTSFFVGLFPIMFRYVDVTLGISLASLVLALAIAFIIAAAYYLEIPVLKSICHGWVSLFRGTPLLAQLFWICYGFHRSSFRCMKTEHHDIDYSGGRI